MGASAVYAHSLWRQCPSPTFRKLTSGRVGDAKEQETGPCVRVVLHPLERKPLAVGLALCVDFGPAWLEVDLKAHFEQVAIARTVSRCVHQDRMHVVGHDPYVGPQVPVHPTRDIEKLATPHATADIVEV